MRDQCVERVEHRFGQDGEGGGEGFIARQRAQDGEHADGAVAGAFALDEGEGSGIFGIDFQAFAKQAAIRAGDGHEGVFAAVTRGNETHPEGAERAAGVIENLRHGSIMRMDGRYTSCTGIKKRPAMPGGW